MIESLLCDDNCIISGPIRPNIITLVEEYITFADSAVKALCVANWGSNGELTYSQAAAVTDLNGVFDYWSNNPPTEQITSFNELQYFTGLINLGESPDGNGQFSGAEQLVEITLPPNLITLGYYTFNSCSNLTSIIIPDSVTTIGEGAFYSCSGLTSIAIPNTVTSIGRCAFDSCSGLKSITIPNSVTSIGEYAFANCNGLTSINVDLNNIRYSSINGVLFNKVVDTLIIYPIDKTGSYSIPNSVTSIAHSGFNGCTGLTSITIPNSITSIGDFVFGGCSGLNSVTIPSSVTSIGEGSFVGCSGLTSITIEAITPPTLGVNAFISDTNLTNIYVPNASVDAYKAATGWSTYASIISSIVR